MNRRLVVVDAAYFLQPQRVLVKFHRGIEIADAQHGVEITHVSCPPENLLEISLSGERAGR